jgi:hypothetical protein
MDELVTAWPGLPVGSQPAIHRPFGGEAGALIQEDGVDPDLDAATDLLEEPLGRVQLRAEGRQADESSVEVRAYDTIDDKGADVQAFLEQLDADPVHVHRLCGGDVISTAIAALPDPLANAA